LPGALAAMVRSFGGLVFSCLLTVGMARAQSFTPIDLDYVEEHNLDLKARFNEIFQ
jgi:hypothetical protein